MTDTKEGSTNKARNGNPAVMVGVVVVIIIVALAMLYYVFNMLAPQPVPINDILSNIREYDESGVVVKGEVSSPTNLIYKWFDLTDESGTIKVITQRGLPEAGETVTVKGIVTEVFSIAGVDFTVIMESADND